jgi:hypothetical protein
LTSTNRYKTLMTLTICSHNDVSRRVKQHHGGSAMSQQFLTTSMVSGHLYKRSRRNAPLGVAPLTGIGDNPPPDGMETITG